MKLSRCVVVLVVAAALATAGCTGSDQAGPSPAAPASPTASRDRGEPVGQVTVAAAAPLAGVLTALGKEFEAVYPDTTVAFRFGSGTNLAERVLAGTPPDVFIADDPGTLRQATERGAASGTPMILLRNPVVIAVTHTNPARVYRVADLGRPTVKVAMCDVQVPCGTAAKQALDTARLKITPVAYTPDAAGALTKIKAGEADAALVYRSDVTAATAYAHGIDFGAAARAGTDYPVVALNSAPNPTGAAAFIGFITSARARQVFTEAGFRAP
jgi:molybdate transport system substrate-binding protein